MIVYYVIFFLLAFFAAFNFPEKERRAILIFFGTTLTLLAGLRGEIANDYGAYLSNYQSIIRYGDGKGGFEVSYNIISRLAGLFDSFQVLIFIYALLSVVLFTYIVIRYWRSDILIMLLWYSFFFFLHTMTQIRIAAAINFFLLALCYLSVRKPWKFSASLVIGGLFHRSVLVLMPLWFFLGHHLKMWLMFVIIAVAIAFSFATDGMSFIANIIGPVIGGGIETRLQMHENTMMGGVGGRTAGIYLIMIFVKLILNFVYRRLFTREVEESSLLRVFMNATFFGCVFYIAFSDFHIVAARIAEMFYITEIFYIPMIAKCVRPRIAGRTAVVLYSFVQFFITIEILGLTQPYRFGI